MRFWRSTQGLGAAALITGTSVLLSRFMGLIRDKVISLMFGATGESDLYFAAFVIPDFLNYLLAGAYFSITLIPFLAEYFERDKDDGWRFFSAVFSWIAMAIVLLTATAMALAPQLARLAAPGLAPESLPRLTYFLRIILPAQVFFLLGSCFTAVLYLRKQFLVPALVPIVYNGMIILGGVLLRRRGMEGFCWGVTAGAFCGSFLLPCLAACQGDGVKLRFALYHPALRRYGILALPLMLGQSIVVLDEQFLRVFGSMAGIGAISWISYARRITLVPVGVVAQAASVASYPFLADLAAKGDHVRFDDTVNRTLRNLLALLVPLSAWMITIAQPTICLIFQQGHFTATDTRQTAQLLQILLTVVFCWGVQQTLGRAFYARQDTVSPAVVGTVVTVVCLPVFYVLATHLRAAGVALASAISITLYTGVLTAWWRHRFGGGAFSGLATAGLKLVGMSLLAAGPTAAVVAYGPSLWGHHPYLGALCAILASGACFGAVFLLLAHRFTPALLQPFLDRVGPLAKRLGWQGPGRGQKRQGD